jgi:hypothetical protein
VDGVAWCGCVCTKPFYILSILAFFASKFHVDPKYFFRPSYGYELDDS